MLRACKGYNIFIYGTSKLEQGYSCGSMLVDKFFLVPHTNESDYFNTIKRICVDENISLVLSPEENDLVIFKKNQFKEALYQYIPDPQIFTLFRDKYHATLAVESLGIKTPKILTQSNDIKVYEKLIRRKRVSCGSRGITVYNQKEFPIHEPLLCDEYLTQPYIEGDEYTVDVFCDEQGSPIIIFPRICLAKKDGTTVRCIVRHNEKLIQACKKVYKKFIIPGISNIQFIIRNDEVYFIELNPRAAATVISTLCASDTNWMELFINHFYMGKPIEDTAALQHKIFWETIISRYYQETVLYGDGYEHNQGITYRI